ncbi:MAG: FtsQ-type POTRA domain-containing protein [Calothrix sp. SM1_5_4]|nr:FtsQ-type POTRA domain-containing protein [Calothrix sp. SM1_5_4]
MKRLARILRWPVTVLLIVLGFAGAALALHPEWVRIGAVEINLAEDSEQHLLYQRIRASLNPQLKAYEGRYFWSVSLQDVFEVISRDKRVKRVSIRREFPSRVKIEIEPHTPVLAYLAGDGRMHPIATDATLLPPLPPRDAPDIPLLRGESKRDDIKENQAVREAALELYASVPDEGEFTKRNVSEIIYSKKEGFKIFITGGSAEVKLGDTDFGPKISRVKKVLSYLESQNIKGRVIDARFSKKVVVRVRNTP